VFHEHAQARYNGGTALTHTGFIDIKIDPTILTTFGVQQRRPCKDELHAVIYTRSPREATLRVGAAMGTKAAIGGRGQHGCDAGLKASQKATRAPSVVSTHR
jgi:hypothetical protein